jgi:hypothetical protein
MFGLCPLMAQTITYTISGKLGPVLSGSDPLNVNGKSGVVTAVVGSTLIPKSKTKTSATYTLPAGAITVKIGGSNYATKGPSTLKYTFPAKGPDTMVVSAKVSADGISGTVVGTASLAKGSFTRAVLKHPTRFEPSTQTLTSATTATGPGSKVEYSASILGATVLGLSGNATN